MVFLEILLNIRENNWNQNNNRSIHVHELQKMLSIFSFITKKKNLQNSEKLKFEPPASWSKPKEMKKIRFWSSKDVEFFMSKLELDRVNFQVN